MSQALSDHEPRVQFRRLRVGLVSLPFASVARPSLGLALLRAVARDLGHACEVTYGTARFAASIGPDLYTTISERLPTASLVGEWVFREAAFGPHDELDLGYHENVLRGEFAHSFDESTIVRLQGVRAASGAFVEQTAVELVQANYDVLGFTTTFHQTTASLAVARRVKSMAPDTAVVFGGANCEGVMGEALLREFSFIDAVCSGEGEFTFRALLEDLSIRGALSSESTYLCRSAPTVAAAGGRERVMEMDAAPIPDYRDFFEQLTKAGVEVRSTVPFEMSRGCWWGAKKHCTFCGLNGSTMTFRSKSPHRALHEMQLLDESYDTMLMCVDNILDYRYFESVLPVLAERPVRHGWFVETKVNLKRPQVLLLARSGVRVLQPGIESLSTRVLGLMRKGCDLLQILQTLKWAHSAGVAVAWNLLYGFPGEQYADYEAMERLIPSLHHLHPPGAVGRIRLDRFSPYFNSPSQYGFSRLRPTKAYGFVFGGVDEGAREDLAYYFEADHNLNSLVETYTSGVRVAVAAWRRDADALLEARPVAEALQIRDTRGGRSVTVGLTGLERSVYEICDEAKTYEQLFVALGDTLFADAETRRVRRFLDECVSKRLMVEENGRFLSIATACGLWPTEGEQRSHASER